MPQYEDPAKIFDDQDERIMSPEVIIEEIVEKEKEKSSFLYLYKHFEREKMLIENIIAWLSDKADHTVVNDLKNRLEKREVEEKTRKPFLWLVLTGFILTLYLMGRDFYRHEKEEPSLLKDMQSAMSSLSHTFSIPQKSQKGHSERILFWFSDFSHHLMYQRKWEEGLLEAIKGYRLKESSRIYSEEIPKSSDETYPYLSFLEKCPHCGRPTHPGQQTCECGWVLIDIYTKDDEETTPSPHPIANQLNLIVIPTNRKIEIREEKIFGREDFEEDISEEELMYISRRMRPHFKILRENNKFYIQDDSSTGGTKLNGEEIKDKGKKELKNGDEISLADTLQLRVEVS